MAAPAEARLKSLMAYCRVPEPTEEDKTVILEAYAAAVAYLEGAGVPEPEAGSALQPGYDMCVNYMVLDTYDHRDAKEEREAQENSAFRRRLNQLKLLAGLEGLVH